MKLQKLFIFSLCVVVSVTLLGCGNTPSSETVTQTQLQGDSTIVQDSELVIDNNSSPAPESITTQRMSSQQILYAAKVGDSIEAHPAHLTVTVELENDIITAVELDQIHSSPKSQRHQAGFAREIEAQVVGKTLSESDDVYLSVASSTSSAFNDAITQIQEQLQQS